MKLIPLLVCLSLLLAAGLILIPQSAQATALPAISVSGTHITVGGTNAASTIQGFDETTALIFAVDAYVNGQTANWGKNMNFPVPDSGKLAVDSLPELWYAYFWFCAHYNMQAVRIGAGDIWGTGMLYNAWKNHPTQFFQVLDEMCHQANDRGIYVELVIAGSQEYPVYTFGGTGTVWTHSHAAGTAYQNYFLYAKSIANHFNSSSYNSALFAVDCWNEPDHTSVVAGYWHTDKTGFHNWASAVAADITPQSPHIIDMGVGTVGDNLFTTWGSSDFQLATGNNGFDVCHRHFYASASDNYLFDDPHTWANTAGKPLIWGEIDNNANYPYTRWTFAEQRISHNLDGAWFTMVMRGTSGYPYTGSYPIAETPAPPTPVSLNALITCDHNYGQISYTVHFSSLVTGGTTPYTYSWHFGDGVTSSSANPSHTYTTAGTYSAYLTVTCTGDSDISNAITIRTYAPALPPPAPPPIPPVIPVPGPIDEGANYTYANTTGNSSLDATMDVFGALLPVAIIISIFGLLIGIVRYD